MRYVYAVIMLVLAVIAFYDASRIIYGKSYKKLNHILFSLTALGSGMWSLGYGMMFYTENDRTFLVFRSVGIGGMFMFLVCAQMLLTYISNFTKRYNKLIWIELLAGIVVLTIIHRPSSVTLTHTDAGIITSFNSSIVSLVYTLYMLLVAALFVVMTFNMAFRPNRKVVNNYGKRFLWVEGIILFGMVFDTLLPAVGINYNIPASTILQSLGLSIIYHAVHMMDRNQINIGNMANYIYESMRLPVMVFDDHGKMVISNARAREMFDLDLQDADFDFWKECIGREFPDVEKDKRQTFETEAFYEKKELSLHLYLDVIRDEYGDLIGTILLVSDVSLAKRYQEELMEAKDLAQKANAAKSMFLANMSHEIRTPMNSIIGFTKLGLDDEVNEVGREYLEDIHDSAEILLAIINDILDLSKIEAGRMEVIKEDYRLADLLNEVSLIISMQAKNKNLDFKIDIDGRLPDGLYGDKGKLRQILINILNNSVKYTKEGFVQLTVQLLGMEKHVAHLKIEIQDSGMGIKEEDLREIFQKFRRVDERVNSDTEGTGLGLSITKGLVELLGGQISVESIYGQGTVFMVELYQTVTDASPIRFEFGRNHKAEETEKKQLLLKDANILAVDDNQTNLKVIKKAMERYGVDIDLATSGNDAIELCRTHSYDLVFMDHMMPIMDGVVAMQCIRNLGRGYETGAKRKIVALTANVVSGARESLLAEGFDDFIGKPINFAELEAVLVRHLPKGMCEYTITNEVLVSGSKKVGKQVEEQKINQAEEQAEKQTDKQTAGHLLDTKTGIANLMDDEEAYRETLEILIHNQDSDIAELTGFYEAGNLADFTIKVHGLKSQCRYVGGKEPGEKAWNLEQAGKEGKEAFIDENLADFISCYRALIKEIEDYLG